MPSVFELLSNPPSKEAWKRLLNCKVHDLVEAAWKADIESQSSTKYLNPLALNVGSSHHIWSTVRDNIHDIRWAQIKCKILKVTYILQANRVNKTFSKFYRRYFDLISKFQVGLKSLLRQGLSEPDFYGVLVYKLKKIVGSNNFSAQFIKVISHYKKIGYNINVLQQTACLVVNPITVGNFAFLFNCTPVGRTSDSMMVLT